MRRNQQRRLRSGSGEVEGNQENVPSELGAGSDGQRQGCFWSNKRWKETDHRVSNGENIGDLDRTGAGGVGGMKPVCSRFWETGMRSRYSRQITLLINFVIKGS